MTPFGTYLEHLRQSRRMQQKQLVHGNAAPREAMAIRQALRRFRSGVKEPLVIIIEAIREGLLRAYAPSKEATIREWAFDDQQCEGWYRARFSGSELFSITEAAKRLGIHQEFAYQLVRAGLLETDQSDTQLGRLVSQHSVDKFCLEYLLLRDLA